MDTEKTGRAQMKADEQHAQLAQLMSTLSVERNRGAEGETHRGSGWRYGQVEARGAAGWSRTGWPGRARGS